MSRKNVVIREDGTYENLREDLPKEDRYFTQIVTVKRAYMGTNDSGGALQFKIETHEKRDIYIYLTNDRDISRLLEVFRKIDVKDEKEMEGETLICYSDINHCTFGIGIVKEGKVEKTIRLVDSAITPNTEEQLIHQWIGYFPSDDEWKQFCKLHK